MGVTLLGFFSNNHREGDGALILSIAHGVVSPALFILVGGILYDRTHTQILKYYRGLVQSMPLFSIFFFVFTLANMAVPLTANFIGEFLSFTGAFSSNPIMTSIGASGMVLAAAYSVWLFNRVCFGSASLYLNNITDITRREFFLLLPLLLITIIIGIYPDIVLDSVHLSISNLLISDSTNLINSPPLFKL